MSLGRIVPWCDWQEWTQVGHWLLSGEEAEVQQGLDRVAAWRSRGRVPLGVDSTAALVETRLGDRPEGVAESMLRAQYAMTLVRMVNGIADSSQRGKVAASVASLASSAGLPRILVDLRHEATHNELPTLAALRLAAGQALTWLQANYWQRQRDHADGCLRRVSGMVQDYVGLHIAAATKVAVRADGADSDSGGEDARQGARGAAPGHAAAGAAAGAGPSADYLAAEGKKRRRALLAELKSAVPKPAAWLLVEGTLDAGSAAVGPGSGCTLAAGAERGVALALGQLAQEWPSLPAVLLRVVVQGLVASAGLEQSAGGTAGIWLDWLRRLLPNAEAGGGRGGGATPGSPMQPLAQQAAELLASCLPAAAAEARRAAAEWVRSGERSPGLTLLQQAVQLLLPLLRQGGRVREEASGACSAVLAAAEALSCAGGQERDAAATALDAALQQAEAALRELQPGPAPEDADARPAKRWRRIVEWSPCAIGMLPCAFDDNGRRPPLDREAAAPPAAARPLAAALPAEPAAAAGQFAPPAAAAGLPAAELASDAGTAGGEEPWPALAVPLQQDGDEEAEQGEEPGALRPASGAAVPSVQLLI